jgi:Uma2 family endonuclease
MTRNIAIKGAVCRALDRAIIEAVLPCQALPDGATVDTGESNYEPDALVNGGAPMADDAIAAANPVIVIEVLSPGTASTDTGGKLAGYFNIPSIAHYPIPHPTRRLVTHHRRAATSIDTSIILEGPITLAPPGLTITLEEICGAR